MKPSKEQVLSLLKKLTAPGEAGNLVDTGCVKNVLIFDKEVEIDLLIGNPSLQAKKRIEVDIMKLIHNEINPKLSVKVNVRSDAPKTTEPQIRGARIEGIANIIAIASGKGGVGKSTLSVNVAVSLAHMGFRVGLLDADIYGPSAPLMLDLLGKKPLAVNVNGRSKMKPEENYGVKVLSLGFFTEANQAVIWRGPMASKALNQLIFDVHWGELDFLVIDLPPGTGDIHLSVLQSLPITGAVIVSTPQPVALADARKAVAMFKQPGINVPILGIVENMAYFTPDELPDKKYYIFGQNGARHLAEELDVPFLGEVPIETAIREAGDFGHPTALAKGTPAQAAFEGLTKEIVKQTVNRNTDLPPSEAVKITTMAGCSQ